MSPTHVSTLAHVTHQVRVDPLPFQSLLYRLLVQQSTAKFPSYFLRYSHRFSFFTSSYVSPSFHIPSFFHIIFTKLSILRSDVALQSLLAPRSPVPLLHLHTDLRSRAMGVSPSVRYGQQNTMTFLKVNTVNTVNTVMRMRTFFKSEECPCASHIFISWRKDRPVIIG